MIPDLRNAFFELRRDFDPEFRRRTHQRRERVDEAKEFRRLRRQDSMTDAVYRMELMRGYGGTL